MKLIPLSKNKYAKVDDDVYEQERKHQWHFDGKYARRNIRVSGKLIHIYLHKVVAKHDGKVDHINLDQLDDRRENLRPCTTQTNAVNSRKAPNKSSRYKGVSKCGSGWRTQIWYNNERLYDAFFPTERIAALAYDL